MTAHGLATRMLHADAELGLGTNQPVVAPLSVATTYIQPDPADLAAHLAEARAKHFPQPAVRNADEESDAPKPYIYSRMSNPTLDRVEAVLGALEQHFGDEAHAVVYASGLAAMTAALHHAQPRRIITQLGYHGTFSGMGADRDVLVVESPSNPWGTLPNLPALASWIKQTEGTTLIVDATLAPPPLQNIRQIAGVDLVVHSATKFLGGHSDLLCGAVIARDRSTAATLRRERTYLGAVPGNLETWLLLRSLRTVHLRVTAQAKTATQLATWLQSVANGDVPELEGTVTKVHHASVVYADDGADSDDPLTAAPSSVARALFPTGQWGSVMSVELASRVAARALPHLVAFGCAATSLGGVESLLEWRWQHDKTVPDTLVRVSIGLEEFEDLKADWTRALLAAKDVAEAVAAATDAE
ncbi:hypothetical protein AMAG_15162 [Allomyces macrogynus ATCC 38327]|uniref:Cystathionine beta-lyase n=1 Tax=Allomyces macrogynus (strain ATCC 38327) TaxID=578462 RepID=A0A0L0T6K9_ALLM3|nr:hypothetical protein AMAG_15162 [Allomyces macrogynus ATCC 38327]|eukprot:KNE70194.1 hypothetical protein AMAG_15162 [Allomyces macrogynus ATCC 38327]